MAVEGAAGRSASGTEVTGAVEGTVTDTTGSVLPGVTITAASDALMALPEYVLSRDR